MQGLHRVLWIFFLLLWVGVFLLVPPFVRDHETGLEGVWKYRVGDSPQDAAGQFVWLSEAERRTASAWSEFSYPGKPTLPDDTRMVWLHTKLPKTAVAQPTLFFATTDEAFSVYLDDEFLYQYKNLTYSSCSFGMAWHLIELPPAYEGKTLSFRIYSNYPDSLGIIDRLAIDSGSGQMIRLLKHDMMYVLSFPVAIFMVMIVICCYVNTRQHRKIYLNIIVFFSLLSLWIAAASDAKLLLLNWPVFWWHLLLFAVYSMPVFLMRIVHEIINLEYKKWVKRILRYYTWLWVAAVGGEIVHPGVMHHMLTFFYLTAAPLQMIVCYQVGISVLKGNEECRALLVGIICLPLLALYDVLGSHFRVIPWFTHFTPLSTFAFALFILQIVSHKVSEEQRLAIMNSHLKDAMESAVLQSMIDPLTNCFNRSKLKNELEARVQQARNSGEPLSLLMLDIDYFKRVNDECGHEAGDAVLVNFAHVLQCRLTSGQVLIRYGGEEFIVLCSGAALQQAAVLAEQIRSSVEHYAFFPDRTITCSIGVSQWRRTTEDGLSDPILKRVDLALYAAKERGRNRVVTELEI